MSEIEKMYEDADIDFIDNALRLYFRTNEIVITTDEVEDV